MESYQYGCAGLPRHEATESVAKSALSALIDAKPELGPCPLFSIANPSIGAGEWLASR